MPGSFLCLASPFSKHASQGHHKACGHQSKDRREDDGKVYKWKSIMLGLEMAHITSTHTLVSVSGTWLQLITKNT